MTEFWTVERIDALFNMVRDGKSMSQVAAVLGCSKNAAIGKHNRLRDSLGIARPKAAPRKRTLRVVRAEKVSVPLPPPPTPKPVAEIKPPEILMPIVPASEPPKSTAVSIVDVTGCRYAIADDVSLIGGKAFCNAPLDGQRSYCAEHAMVVYVAPAKATKHKRFRTIPTTLLRMRGA